MKWPFGVGDQVTDGAQVTGRVVEHKPEGGVLVETKDAQGITHRVSRFGGMLRKVQGGQDGKQRQGQK